MLLFLIFLVFNLVKKLSIDSPFWGKTIYDFVHFLVGLFEIYVYFLFTVLLYRLTNLNKWGIAIFVNVNIRMYNFDDVQCTVIPSVAYGFVTGMNLQLC